MGRSRIVTTPGAAFFVFLMALTAIATVARSPLGLAFATVPAERPAIPLRIDDGRHLSLAGTNLAACTFFAALYQQSPEGLGYDAGLGKETAGYLQQVAWKIVRDHAVREQ